MCNYGYSYNFLIVSINSKKGMKNFYFRTGLRTDKELETLKTITKLGNIAELDLT